VNAPSDRLRTAFAHNAWANDAALRALLGAHSVPARASEVMAHIVGAESLWLRRLGRQAPDLAVWPSLTPRDCVPFLPVLAAAWTSLLDAEAGDGFARSVSYTNTKGERWMNTAADILTHVTLHSSYHRGQIAMLLGRSGNTPPYTDYIEFVRRGPGAPGHGGTGRG
jgi:uncharacterized damage-inducible protein DinB